MTAAVGTIPALPPYQPNALVITGQELVEIASSSNATSAISASMLITDVVGKAPSAMQIASPAATDIIAFFQSSSQLPRSCTFGNLGINGLGLTLSTAATTGFLALPNCIGTPTGVPTTGAGSLVFDTLHNFVWVYNTGWKHVAVT